MIDLENSNITIEKQSITEAENAPRCLSFSAETIWDSVMRQEHEGNISAELDVIDGEVL